MGTKKEVAWRKMLGRLQRCKCKCPFNKKGYCQCDTPYTQSNYFEPRGVVTSCKLEITEEGIMAHQEVETCE